MVGVVLQGARLRLRPWRLPEDYAPLYAINGDPVVMRFFAHQLTRAESDDWAERIAAHFEPHGWGFWVVELPGDPVAGVVGLQHLNFAAPFATPARPAVEIGWRIAARHQRQGFAREAAGLALDYGFGTLHLPRVVAFTPPANTASWGLMEQLGMTRAGLFDHPRIEEGHALRPHLLYTLRRQDFTRCN